MLDAMDAGLGHAPYTVTGITVNPAARDEVLAVAVSRADDVGERAQAWVGDTNPAATDGTLQADVQSANLHIVTRDQVEDRARREAQSRVLGALRPIELFAFVLAAAAPAGVLSVVVTRLGPVREALEGAGQSAGGALVTAAGALLALPVLGAAVGIALGIGTLHWGGPAIGRHVGQEWEAGGAGAADTGIAAAFVLGYTFLALACTLVLATQRRLQSPVAQEVVLSRRARRWTCVAAGAGVVLALALIAVRLAQVLLDGHFFGFALLALTLPLFVLRLPWLRSTPIHQRAAFPASPAHLVPLASAALLCLITSFGSAGLVADVTSQKTLDPHAGFLDVEYLTSQDVAYLRATYPDIMREGIVLRWPDDSAAQARATTPEDIACFASAVGSGQDAESEGYLQLIAFAPSSGPGSDLAGTVSTVLVPPGVTSVPIVFFEPANGRVQSTGELTVAHRSSAIGGNVLPAVILPADSADAAAIGIVPSDQGVEVYIPDFTVFPDDERNDFRSDVLTRSGYAFVSESNSTDRLQQTTTAFTYSAFAALATLAVAILSSLMLAAHQRPLREAVELFAPSRWQRVRVVLPHATAWILTVAVSCSVGTVASAWSFPQLLTPGAYDPRWFWAMPIPAVVVAMVVALVIAAREQR